MNPPTLSIHVRTLSHCKPHYIFWHQEKGGVCARGGRRKSPRLAHGTACQAYTCGWATLAWQARGDPVSACAPRVLALAGFSSRNPRQRHRHVDQPRSAPQGELGSEQQVPRRACPAEEPAVFCTRKAPAGAADPRSPEGCRALAKGGGPDSDSRTEAATQLRPNSAKPANSSGPHIVAETWGGGSWEALSSSTLF